MQNILQPKHSTGLVWKKSARAFTRLQKIVQCECSLKHGLHLIFGLVRVVQKDPKYKGLNSESLSFGNFCTTLTSQKTKCEPYLTISISPDDTTCTWNSGKAKMLKGIGRRFHQFARLSYEVLWRKSFLEKYIKRPILTGNGLWSKLNFWLHGQI